MSSVDIALFLLKTITLIGLGVYALFAAVILRQEQLMSHVLEESFEPVLRFFAVAHLLVALGVFGLAFILL